jgi:uncharacterized protein
MQFLILGWDTPQSSQLRPAARPAHLAHWVDWETDGRIILAGPMTDFAGSAFVVDAESLEDVQAKALADPFVAAGVFSRVEVHPFRISLGPLKGRP